MSNHLDALVAPTGFPMDTLQSAHTVEVVYVAGMMAV